MLERVSVKRWRSWKRWKMSDFLFREKAWEDFLYWQSHDKKVMKRINALLRDIRRYPAVFYSSPVYWGFSEGSAFSPLPLTISIASPKLKKRYCSRTASR